MLPCCPGNVYLNRGQSFKSAHKLAMDQVGTGGEKRKRTTVKDMLWDLWSAMGDFQRDGPFDVDFDSAHYLSRSIELLVRVFSNSTCLYGRKQRKRQVYSSTRNLMRTKEFRS